MYCQDSSTEYSSGAVGVPLVHENTQLSLIFDFNKLLAAIGRLLWLSVDAISPCRIIFLEETYEGDVLAIGTR